MYLNPPFVYNFNDASRYRILLMSFLQALKLIKSTILQPPPAKWRNGFPFDWIWLFFIINWIIFSKKFLFFFVISFRLIYIGITNYWNRAFSMLSFYGFSLANFRNFSFARFHISFSLLLLSGIEFVSCYREHAYLFSRKMAFIWFSFNNGSVMCIEHIPINL